MQWIHGDIQLENVLFHNDRVSGIVDFDNVNFSLRELDLMFALFSLCRVGTNDDSFYYDEELFNEGIDVYKASCSISGETLSLALLSERHREAWRLLFCLDQATNHLIAAQRGIWELEPGIGFLPCFWKVVHYRDRT